MLFMKARISRALIASFNFLRSASRPACLVCRELSRDPLCDSVELARAKLHVSMSDVHLLQARTLRINSNEQSGSKGLKRYVRTSRSG